MVTTETSVQTHKRTQRRLYGHTIPRKAPKGKVIDYLNGSPTDERATNKQFVTPEEAERRKNIRRILKLIGHDPRALSLESLKEIYRRYTFASEEEAPRPPKGGARMKMKDERTKERTKEKLRVLSFVRCTDDRNVILVKTTTGSIFAREHFKAKGWFGTRDGRILHLTERYGLREVKADDKTGHRQRHGYRTSNGVPGNATSYVFSPYVLRLIAHTHTLHVFIWECWYGARTPGMQIDHINGCELDNRIINLQEVTPEENQYRGIVLDSMRKAKDENGMSIYNMAVFEKEPFRLINIFDVYRHLYRPKTKNDELKLAINPSYDKINHRHGNK